MLGGYIEFFMDPTLADCYIKLKEELEMLLQKKVNFQVSHCLFDASIPSYEPFYFWLDSRRTKLL